MLKNKEGGLANLATTEIRMDALSIQSVEGKLLTIIDASIIEPVRGKAVKDLVRNALWEWACKWNYGFTREQWEANQKLGMSVDGR